MADKLPRMNLAPGTLLGPYEIERLLGAGGMGEVYVARDARLRRVVAVKMILGSFADDPERVRRFEQEARAAAALNHPGVLAVYDIGRYEGAPYLVTELLEGTTLRQKLEAERLSVRKVIDYGTQVAQALAAAHDKGIVHRDLKPDNLFVTANDRVKILDFGLAKLTAPPIDAEHTRIDVTGTLHNAVVGTIGYMAPEQARGQAADHRSDIFAFGCVLFEMLQGRRAFERDTAVDTLSAILSDPPPVLTSSPDRPLPPALDDIVRRCLEKDPTARFQSASDLAFALTSLRYGSDTAAAAEQPRHAPAEPLPARRKWMRMAGIATAVAAAAALGLFAGGARRSPAPPVVAEFLVPPPAADLSFSPMPLPGLAPTAPQAGLSPDGRLLAFVAADSRGARQLWIRSLDASLPRVVERSEGATSWPFWSPDSRVVVFGSHGALMKHDVVTGTTERFVRLPEEAPAVPFVTGAWSSAGAILFTIGGATGIYRIPASGGTAAPITTLDRARGDHYHSWPQPLPDGRMLFFVRTNEASSTGMYVLGADGGQSTLVLASASRAVYASAHLLWAIEERLVAQPFDHNATRLTGEAVTLVPAVYQGAGRTPAFWVSDDTLVYSVAGSRERQFRWFDRNGTALQTVGPPGFYGGFDLSSDGGRFAVEVMKDGPTTRSTISMLDTTRGVLTPITFGELNDNDPRLGPAGRVAFARNTGDMTGIVEVDETGSNPKVLFPRGPRPVIWLEDRTADGQSLIFRSGTDRDVWQVAAGRADPARLTQARAAYEQVQLSPDARWMAYNTAESGQSEVYLSSVAADGKRWQLSTGGGVQPIWRGDGRELYYLGLDAGLYVVDLAGSGDQIAPGQPRLLFRTSLPVISAVVEQYRTTADAGRFLFCLPVSSPQREPLRMLLNWPVKLGRGSR
jgi:eukaryotic-like serine/threonine-protein kinase